MTRSRARALPWLLLPCIALLAPGCPGPSNAATTDASMADDTGHAHGDDAGSTADAGAENDAASAPDAIVDPPADAGPISAECAAYCECYERDCAAIQAIPTGQSCAAFCATFTAEQWDCRISHCRLVVPEMYPPHCMHAVGIDQCL